MLKALDDGSTAKDIMESCISVIVSTLVAHDVVIFVPGLTCRDRAFTDQYYCCLYTGHYVYNILLTRWCPQYKCPFALRPQQLHPVGLFVSYVSIEVASNYHLVTWL